MPSAAIIDDESLLAVVKVASVAILFAVCGALSSLWLLPDFPDRFEFLFPLPFALLCTVLFMRKDKAVFAVVLMEIIWLISSFAGFSAGASTRLSPLPGFVGGSIGGVGLVLCVAVCHPSVLSLKRLGYGGLIGAIAGLAFTSWTQVYMDQHYGANANQVFPKTVPIQAFAIWQAVVGAYLYVIVKQSARST